MRPVITDRMAVIGILAGLVLWVCCLTVLWGWAFDASGSFSLLSGFMILLVTWAAFLRRAWLARRALGTLGLLRLRTFVPLQASLEGRLGSSKEDVQLRMRLLSTAGIVAAACFVLGTLCIPLARLVSALLGEWFLLSDGTWRGLEILALLAGSLPVGLGLAGVLYASTVVRAAGGRDTYASAYRDWICGAGLGFGAFAVAWWFGANLIYLVFSVAGVILVAAMTAVSRMELSTHPRKAMLPVGTPSRGAPWRIAAAHGLLGLVLLIQVRLLADVLGIDFTRRMIWVFLSLFLLLYFLGRVDRKGRIISRQQAGGAVLGIAAGLLGQTAEMFLCCGRESGATLLLFFAVVTQIPIASLGAMLLSSQRRGFAVAGGSAGRYLTAGIGGLVTGITAYAVLGVYGDGIALLVLAGLMILGSGVDGAIRSRRWVSRAQWVVWSALLCAAAILGLFRSAQPLTEQRRQVQPGVWLTAVGQPFRYARRYRQYGVLPGEAVRRSRLITRCLYGTYEEDDKKREEGLFALRRGRWWIVATDAEDLPEQMPGRFYAAGANPEPPSQPRRFKRWPPLSYSEPDFFRYARLNFVARLGCDYYDGILLAPLPADHPQAWRCYNEEILHRCIRLAEMHNPDGSVGMGVVALRTQVGPDHIRSALAVARTFHQAVRSGWAVVAVQRNGLDMLLLGPKESLREQRGEKGVVLVEDVREHLASLLKDQVGVYLLAIEELWEPYSGIEPIRLSSPPGERLAGTPEFEGFRNYLEKTRQVVEAQRSDNRGTLSPSAGR